MSSYRVIFRVPAEVVVHLDADDEDQAADQAWELANDHLQSTGLIDYANDVVVLASIDGIGADDVIEAPE